jgi:hypothetical protein
MRQLVPVRELEWERGPQREQEPARLLAQELA